MSYPKTIFMIFFRKIDVNIVRGPLTSSIVHASSSVLQQVQFIWNTRGT